MQVNIFLIAEQANMNLKSGNILKKLSEMQNKISIKINSKERKYLIFKLDITQQR